MISALVRGCTGLLLATLAWPAPVPAKDKMDALLLVDADASEAGFMLRTRWGQRLDGRFPVMAGEVRTLADGHKQVLLRLSARDVEIVGHPRYSRLTRDEAFFDADRHPEVIFVSDPFDADLVEDGGNLPGELVIRGVKRRETFRVEPVACERPMRDCPVVAAGTVNRNDYAMDRWGFALGERVEFRLSLHGQEALAP